MSTKTMEDLRDVLFSTLQGIKDGSMDIEKSRAINDISKTLVDTAKVEVDYLRTCGGGESTFIESAVGAKNLPPSLPREPLSNGISGIVRHRLQG